MQERRNEDWWSWDLNGWEEEIIVAAIDVCPRVLARRRSDRSKRTIDAVLFLGSYPASGQVGSYLPD